MVLLPLPMLRCRFSELRFAACSVSCTVCRKVKRKDGKLVFGGTEVEEGKAEREAGERERERDDDDDDDDDKMFFWDDNDCRGVIFR